MGATPGKAATRVAGRDGCPVEEIAARHGGRRVAHALLAPPPTASAGSPVEENAMTDPKQSPAGPRPEIPAPSRRGDDDRPSVEPAPSPPRPEIPAQTERPEIPPKPQRDLPQPDRERA